MATLKEKLEDNVVIVVAATAIASFVAGWGANDVVSSAGPPTPERAEVTPKQLKEARQALDRSCSAGRAWLNPGARLPAPWELESWIQACISRAESHKAAIPSEFFSKMDEFKFSANDIEGEEVRNLVRAVVLFIEETRKGIQT